MINSEISSNNNLRSTPSPELTNFYRALREILGNRGVNLSAVAQAWALQQKLSLAEFGADFEFEALCRKNCHPVSLAVCLFVIGFYPIAVEVFQAGGAPFRRGT
jgi:hypothetical protein